MRNVMVSMILQPDAMKDNWKWIPRIDHNAWDVINRKKNKKYKVKYFNVAWLCFELSVDNEKS